MESYVVFLYMAWFSSSERHYWRNLPWHKKRKTLTWLSKNRASDCWAMVPRLLKSCDGNCWRIMPVTVEELSQWMLENRASDSWLIVQAAAGKWYQWLLKNRSSCCWTIVRATTKRSYQRLLNGHARCFFSLFYLLWWNPY